MTTSTKRAYSTPTVLELGDLRTLTAKAHKSGSSMSSLDCDVVNGGRPRKTMNSIADGGYGKNGGGYEGCAFDE